MDLDFLVPFLVSLLSVPVFMKIAKKMGIVDRPNGVLKIHGGEIPYLGGLGMFFGLVPVLWKRTDLLLVASVSVSLGLVDDILNVDPKLRLAVELSISAYMVYTFVGFENVLYSLTLMVAFAALVNAVNMMDGLDGVCAGSVAISSIFFALFSQNDLTHSLSLATLGTSLGYLVYNFPPARVFMGDSGSYLLGTMLSILYASSVRGPNPTMRTLEFVFPLWIYGLDLTAGFVRRLRNGRSPFEGDRDHFYDKINRRLKDEKKTALIVYVLVASFSSITLVCRDRFGCAVGTLLAIFMSALMTKGLNLLDYD